MRHLEILILVCLFTTITKGQEVEWIIEPKLNYVEIGNFSEGLAKVKNDSSKYGFIDEKGNEIIPCIYDRVGDFSEGRVWVATKVSNDEADKLYNYWYLDKIGKRISQKNYFKYLFHSDTVLPDFSEGVVKVYLVHETGYIDKSGKEIIPCPHHNSPNQEYNHLGDLSEGLIWLKRNSKYGYVNTKGEEIIPFIYDKTLSFQDGKACVQKNGKWGVIDYKGKEIIKFQYDDMKSFSEELTSVKKNNKWAVINN